MTAFTFCIDSMVQGYREYQSIWDVPLADWDLPCEWKTGYSHDPQCHGFQEGDHWYPSCKLLGTCLRNIFQSISSIFIIYVRLYHRCVKICMVKIWQIFGRLSVLPNFSSTKVSLHTVCYSYIPLQVGYHCYYTSPRWSRRWVLITMISYKCSGI